MPRCISSTHAHIAALQGSVAWVRLCVVFAEVIQTHLVQAQTLLLSQPQVPGINARCMSNLLWSLVKLEVTSEVDHDSGRLAVEVALISAPLVMHYLPESTGQVSGAPMQTHEAYLHGPPPWSTLYLQRFSA